MQNIFDRKLQKLTENKNTANIEIFYLILFVCTQRQANVFRRKKCGIDNNSKTNNQIKITTKKIIND